MSGNKKKFSVCIACLCTDVKMFDLCSSGLLDPYKRVTGVQEVEECMSEHKLCWECAALVNKFNSFRLKCETAYVLLRDLYSVQNKVTKRSLKTIDRNHFGLVSTISNTGVLNIHITAEEYVKSDTVNDEDVKIKTEHVQDVSDAEKEFTETDNYFKDDYFDDAPSVENGEAENFLEESKPEKVRKVNRKGASPRKRAKNDSTMLEIVDSGVALATDMSDYTTVITLTQEQQMQEILLRKESTNYKRGSYKCDLCYKGFAHEEAYVNHMLKHDPSAGEFECNICRVRWAKKTRLMSHIAQVHLVKYQCKFCPYTAQMKDQALRHYKWHMGVKYKCKICGLEFGRVTTYLSHCRHKHACDEICHICGDSFATRHGLRQHIGLRHKDSLLSHYCRDCDRHFGSAHELRKHMLNTTLHGVHHDWSKECQPCGTKFKSTEELERHRVDEHTIMDDRSGDITIETTTPGEERQTFQCEPCKVAFLSREAWTKHILTSFKHKHERGEIENGCKHCGKTFPDAESLKIHMHSVGAYPTVGEVSFECEQCNEVMTSHREYHAHFRSHHRDKTRTFYPAMKAPAMCEVCGKICQTAIALKQHMNLHTGEKPYKCNVCDRAFAYMTRLKLHERTHTREKPYKCDTCGMPFASSNNMIRHKAVHSDATPYGCEVCGKQFKYKYTVKLHTEYVHMKKPWPRRDKAKRRAQPIVYEYLMDQQ